MQKTLSGETITDEEIITKRLKAWRGFEKIDKIAENYPIMFGEYCDKSCGIQFKIYAEPKPQTLLSRNPECMEPQPDNILVCAEQLKKRFGAATVNMLRGLGAYCNRLKEKEAVEAYIW